MQLGPDLRSRVKFEFVRYTRGDGLDVGHGANKSFPHAVAVRLPTDEECEARKIREIVTESLALLPEVDDGKCDFVIAADVARLLGEHTLAAALDNYLRVVRDGGHVCLYEPELEPRAFIAAVDEVAKVRGIDVLRFEAWPHGGAFIVLQRTGAEPMLARSFERKPAPEKRACVVRHGGIGDQLQAAFLLPALKRAGFHVTVLTTPQGRELIEHDPNVDEWFMVDRGQVPPSDLPWFWEVISQHYERFVNLNESVEGTFLAIPGRVQHQWPHALRHQMLNGNYAEHAAAIAQVPFVAEGQFYPTPQEVERAERFLSEINSDMNREAIIGHIGEPVFVILWALAGSSPHKATPHQDWIVNEVLNRLKRAVVIFVGDEVCKILEAGWEKEPRVYCRSGEMKIRDVLTLAQRVNCVVGPETGVLNAVCYEPKVHKVLMLSHSSRENLSKHWVNTASFAGESPCYPCHQLHYDARYCPRDEESHAALCQQGVPPQRLYAAIDAEYTAWVRIRMLRSAA